MAEAYIRASANVLSFAINASSMVLWLAIRAKFAPVFLLPASLGLAVAYKHGFFDPLYAILTLVGVFLACAAINSFNVYRDWMLGIDQRAKPTPFSGAGDIGGNPIVRNLVSPGSVFRLATALLLVGSAIGIWLSAVRGWLLLFFLANAIIAVYWYSHKISLWGLGEPCVFWMVGPITVCGCYYVMAQVVALEPIYVSLIPGILAAMVLYINEFPDCEADKACGRITAPARLGKERAVKLYAFFMFSAYALIAMGALTGFMPPISLIALGPLPVTMKAVNTALKYYDRVHKPQFVPAMALTVLTAILVSALLIAAYVLHAIFLA
jgi:1,4-dihydroxy-2-naphthoate octaprenyltransferase